MRKTSYGICAMILLFLVGISLRTLSNDTYPAAEMYGEEEKSSTQNMNATATKNGPLIPRESNEISCCDELFIPSLDWISENGYPINDSGETYGPDVKDSISEPDLILVRNKEGIDGYVKRDDMPQGATTLEEAKNWKPSRHVLTMYLQDGKTIVGEFVIESVKTACE